MKLQVIDIRVKKVKGRQQKVIVSDTHNRSKTIKGYRESDEIVFSGRLVMMDGVKIKKGKVLDIMDELMYLLSDIEIK